MFSSFASLFTAAAFFSVTNIPDGFFDMAWRYINEAQPIYTCTMNNGLATRRHGKTTDGPLMISGDHVAHWNCTNGDGFNYTTATGHFDITNQWEYNVTFDVVMSSADVGASDCDALVTHTTGCMVFNYNGTGVSSGGDFTYTQPIIDGQPYFYGAPQIPGMTASDSAVLGTWCDQSIGINWEFISPILNGSCNDLCNYVLVALPNVNQAYCDNFRDTIANTYFGCTC